MSGGGEGGGGGKLPSVDHGRRTDEGRDKNQAIRMRYWYKSVVFSDNWPAMEMIIIRFSV